MKKPKPLFILNFLPPVVLIAIGLRHFVKQGPDAGTVIPVLLGIFALYLALFNRPLLQRVLGLLTKLWVPVGRCIALFLLAATFYLVFMPVGLLLRLIQKDVLNKKFKVNRPSYWKDRPPRDNNDYTLQF